MKQPADSGTPCGHRTYILERVRGPLRQSSLNVECMCGFEVRDLASLEAAKDTKAWHEGDNTTPLGLSPWSDTNA